MSVNHTPGPWRVTKSHWNGIEGPHIMIISEGVLELGIAAAFGDTDKNMIANARLIAAAPDLLTALQVLETAARRYSQGLDSSAMYVLKVCEMSKAAIAKAEGRD